MTLEGERNARSLVNKQEKKDSYKFREKFPRTFEIERLNMLDLEAISSGINKRLPGELLKANNVVDMMVKQHGYEKTFITPGKVKENSNIIFNYFSFPERYLKPLNDLLSLSQASENFAKEGIRRMLRQHSQAKERNACEALVLAYSNKESIPDIENNINLNLVKNELIINKHTYLLEGNEKAREKFNKIISKSKESLDDSKNKRKKADENAQYYTEEAKNLTRRQYVDQLRKEGKDVVYEIAALEAFTDILEVGVKDGLAEGLEADYLRKFYPNSTLDKKTRDLIYEKKKHIREKLRNLTKGPEAIFKVKYQNVYEHEYEKVTGLRNDTKDIAESKKYGQTMKILSRMATHGGFKEILIDTGKDSRLQTYTSTNSLAIPSNYLTNIDYLLTSPFSQEAHNIVQEGMNLLIEEFSVYKEGKTLEIMEKIFETREEVFNLEKRMSITNGKKVILLEKNETLEDAIHKLVKINIIRSEENILLQEVPGIATAQFVEKIRKEGRNVTKEIAIVETFFQYLHGGTEAIKSGIEDQVIKNYLKIQYPDPVLSSNERDEIFKMCKVKAKELSNLI